MTARGAVPMPMLANVRETVSEYANNALVVEGAALTWHAAFLVRRIDASAGSFDGICGSRAAGAGLSIETFATAGGMSVRSSFVTAGAQSTALIALPIGRLVVFSFTFQNVANGARPFFNGVLGTPLTPSAALVPGTSFEIGSGGPAFGATDNNCVILAFMASQAVQADADVLATVRQWDRDLAADRYLTQIAGATRYWDARDLPNVFQNAPATWTDRIGGGVLTRASLGTAELAYGYRARIFD